MQCHRWYLGGGKRESAGLLRRRMGQLAGGVRWDPPEAPYRKNGYMPCAFAHGAKAASSSNAPAKITSKRNGKARGEHVLNFRMVPPKTRRITPFLTIPEGMARLFFDFFGAVAVAVSARFGRDTRATRGARNPPTEDLTTNEHQ